MINSRAIEKTLLFVLLAAIVQSVGASVMIQSTCASPIINCHELGNVNCPGSYFYWTYIELGYGIDIQVDMTDIDLMGLAYGERDSAPWGVGECMYNPDADITEDGLVDMRDIAIAGKNQGKSCDEYWDGYKYSKKVTGPRVEEVIDFYNSTDFVVYWGQEKYENGVKVFDTYYVADWNPAKAFPISHKEIGHKVFEEGLFYLGQTNA